MIPELLFLALDFYRDPRRFDHLRDPNKPLPANLTELLSAPGNSLAPEQLAATAAALNATEAECLACVPFFIKQVLLEPKGDYFRVLGVPHEVPQARIKEHYFYLMRLFHPDKDVDGEGWNDLYAPRINEAYNTLRNTIQRAQYEASLPQADGFNPGELAGESARAGPAPGAAGVAPVSNGPEVRAGTSVLRKPWFYGVIFVAAIALLLGVLMPSDNSAQLTVTAQPRGEGAAFATDETQSRERVAVEAGPEAVVRRDVDASGSAASDERIEEMVKARVAQARHAVLGAPEVKAKPKPESRPEVESRTEPRAEPVAVAAVEFEPVTELKSAVVVAAGPELVPEPVREAVAEPELVAEQEVEMVAEPVAVVEVVPVVAAVAELQRVRKPELENEAKLEPEVVAAAETEVVAQTELEIISEPASAVEIARESVPEPEVVAEAEPKVVPEPEVMTLAEPEPVPQSKPEITPEPEPMQEAVPPPVEQVAAAISIDELNALLASFAARYQAMDASGFADLFTTDAHTTETDGRRGIRRMYTAFFRDNNIQGFTFSNVAWQPRGGDRRSGSALATIVSAPAAGGSSSTVEATIAFQVKRDSDNSLQISRMTY